MAATVGLCWGLVLVPVTAHGVPPATCNGLAVNLPGATDGDDILTGTAGSDVVHLGDGHDQFTGGDGSDTVCGGNGNDTLIGGNGGDTLIGGDGDDRLSGGAGTNSLDGGPGTDLVILSGALGVGAFADLGLGTAVSGIADDTIAIGTVENIDGTPFPDRLIGDDGPNEIDGGSGADLLDGKGGNDRLFGGDGNDSLIGGPGDDLLDGDRAVGSNDSFPGDTFDFDEADYSGDAGPITATMTGNSGTVTGAGTDTLKDVLAIRGTPADDTIKYDATFNSEYTRVNGGPGDDDLRAAMVDYSDAPNGVVIDLLNSTATGWGTDTVSAHSVRGSAFDDTITGPRWECCDLTSIGSVLNGGPGNDVIRGAVAVPGVDPFDGFFTILDYSGLFPYQHGGEPCGNIGEASVGATICTDLKDIAPAARPADFAPPPAGVTVDLVTGVATGWGTDAVAAINSIIGSAGDDTLIGADSPVGINGREGDDTITGNDAFDTFFNFRSGNVLFGDAGDDVITSGPGFDELTGGDGSDQLRAGAGDDLLFPGIDANSGGPRNDVLDGGPGTDRVSYARTPSNSVKANLATGTAERFTDTDTLIAIENLIGTAFGDELTGDAGDNVLQGLEGNDKLDGGDGDDVANFRLLRFGDVSVDVDLAAGTSTGPLQGTDILANIEEVWGSDDDDTIAGDDGPNILAGSGGDDVLDGRGGDDGIFGGSGNDTASYADAPNPVDANLVTGIATGNSTDTLNSIENLIGSPQGDRLIGGFGPNRLEGLAGDDFLDGRAGDDHQDGGDGTDECIRDVPGDTLISCETETAGEPSGMIVIRKDVAGGFDPQDFEFNGSGGIGQFFLDDDIIDTTLLSSATFTDLDIGTYTVTEAAVTGWTVTAITCSDDSSGDPSTATATITLDASEMVTCTFTNEVADSPPPPAFGRCEAADVADESVCVSIGKLVSPNDGTSFDFESAELGDFTQQGEDLALAVSANPRKFASLEPGTYTVTELPTPGFFPIPALDLACDGAFEPTELTLGSSSVTMSLGAGDFVNCDFFNNRHTLTVEKVADPADGTDFAFTSAAVGPFTLDDGTDADAIGDSQQFFVATDTSITITETAVAGWDVQSIDCVINDPPAAADDPDGGTGVSSSSGDAAARSLTVEFGDFDARALTCTFTNTKQPPPPPPPPPAPTVTIDQAGGQADPTNQSPVEFSVVFSEPVTGFAADDVLLGGTSSGGTVTVSGGGATYTVAVDGMSDGTVTADVKADAATGAGANANVASTSTDNQVLYDATPPVINTPGTVTRPNDPGQAGADVSYTVTTDDGGATTAMLTAAVARGSTSARIVAPGGLVCTPPSGSFFPIGTTTVSCTATDLAGNTASREFNVVVVDAESPVIANPGTIIEMISMGPSAAVSYPLPAATDNSGTVTVSCVPPPGSTFGVGTTTVRCTARDPAGNTATTNFDLVVMAPTLPSTGAGTTGAAVAPWLVAVGVLVLVLSRAGRHRLMRG